MANRQIPKIKRPILMFSVVIVLVIMTSLSASVLAATPYPAKPVTMITGFPAGGGGDIAGRVVADYFSKKWGKQIIVVNKPGGNQVPAVLDVYNAKPDGYTLLSDVPGSSTMQLATMSDLPYKLEDRTFLCGGFSAPSVVCTSMARPWKTVQEVADFVKREPGDFKWGALGSASLATLATAQFLNGVGVDIAKTKRIDFRGAPELFASLAGGHIDFVVFGVPSAMPLIEANKIRPIAVLPERVKKLPNVPAAKEAGFGWWNAYYWVGVSGPPKLPQEIVEKWERGMKEASTDREFISKAENIGFLVDYSDHEGFRKRVLEEAKMWQVLVKKLGIAPQ